MDRTRAGERMAWRKYWRTWLSSGAHPWSLGKVVTLRVEHKVWLAVAHQTHFLDDWHIPIQDSIRAIVAKGIR